MELKDLQYITINKKTIYILPLYSIRLILLTTNTDSSMEFYVLNIILCIGITLDVSVLLRLLYMCILMLLWDFCHPFYSFIYRPRFRCCVLSLYPLCPWCPVVQPTSLNGHPRQKGKAVESWERFKTVQKRRTLCIIAFSTKMQHSY